VVRDPQPLGVDPGSGDLRIDTNETRRCTANDERIRLTGMEFSLLGSCSVSRSGERFSRGEILKEVWGYFNPGAVNVNTRVVVSTISSLRSNWRRSPPTRAGPFQPGARVILFQGRSRESVR